MLLLHFSPPRVPLRGLPLRQPLPLLVQPRVPVRGALQAGGGGGAEEDGVVRDRGVRRAGRAMLRIRVGV